VNKCEKSSCPEDKLPCTERLNDDVIDVRPFQLMCILCRFNTVSNQAAWRDDLNGLYGKIKNKHLQLLRLCCNVDTCYQYQNPGIASNSPEGEWYNIKRDLDIMQRLGLVPGDIRPAHELFERLKRTITATAGICGYDNTTSETWKGCEYAKSRKYSENIQNGVIEQIFPPRSESEIRKSREEGGKAIIEAKEINLIPMHFMCIACFHAGRTEPEPIEADLIYEVWDRIREEPEIPIKIVRKRCMVCPPCKLFDPEEGMCVYGGKIGAELRQLQKELTILRKLGLNFGDVVKANELFSRVFQNFSDTREVCAYNQDYATALEWSICGGPEGGDYPKGREVCLGIKGVNIEKGAGNNVCK